ncbi:hypothetical protein [Pseudomonas xanthosomatis]|uniref:hypothetical protein n=1 Tax=Pseudomonas xanthosomatis TaxID=2842356 RepID=UPI003511CE0D
MSHPKSVNKQLKSLNMSGYGDYMHLSSHPKLGQGVYEVDLDACTLKFFEKGAIIKHHEKDIDILYSDILSITSHLSAPVFSQASASRNFNTSIPLEIHLSESTVALEIQLPIYSRTLIVLNDMWRNCKE